MCGVLFFVYVKSEFLRGLRLIASAVFQLDYLFCMRILLKTQQGNLLCTYWTCRYVHHAQIESRIF